MKIDIVPIKHLLWDIDLSSFNPQDYRNFLAERIAEKGNIPELNWYFRNFGFPHFMDVINQSPNISLNTRNFWNKFMESRV